MKFKPHFMGDFAPKLTNPETMHKVTISKKKKMKGPFENAVYKL